MRTDYQAFEAFSDYCQGMISQAQARPLELEDLADPGDLVDLARYRQALAVLEEFRRFECQASEVAERPAAGAGQNPSY